MSVEVIRLHPDEQEDEKAYLRQEYVRTCTACGDLLNDEPVAFLRFYPDRHNPLATYDVVYNRHEDYPIHERCAPVESST